MKIEKFDLQICEENVLDQIDCKKGSELYPEVARELAELLPQAYEKLRPVALLAFGRTGSCYTDVSGVNNPRALFALTSVGGEISRWSTETFRQGDCLRGMLIDGIANDYLFQMEHTVAPYIKAMCAKAHCGVYRRLEAPADIDMSVQKEALKVTNGQEAAGIRIMESYMYDPVKTTCQVFLLDKDEHHMALKHDCSHCPNLNCKLRSPGPAAALVL